jgi:hypothetical protein
VYSPESRVEHRVETTRLSKLAVYRRAFQLGAGSVYTRWKPEQAAEKRANLGWRLHQAWRAARSACQLPVAAVTLNENERVLGILYHLAKLGREIELVRYRPMLDDSGAN